MWVVLAGNFKYSFGIIHIRASCLCCVMGVGATPFRHTFESPCRKFRFARPCLWVIEFAWHHAQLSFMPVLCGRVWRHTFSAHFEPVCLASFAWPAFACHPFNYSFVALKRIHTVRSIFLGLGNRSRPPASGI